MDATIQHLLPTPGDAAARIRKGIFCVVMDDMMQGSRIPTFTGTSGATAAEIEAGNGEWDAIKRQRSEGIAGIDYQVNNCLTGDFSELLLAVENFSLDKLQLAQRVAQQWGVSLELAERQAAELRPLSEPLLAEAERLLVEVKAGLTALGSGLESHPAYRDNRHAAEKQFDFAARVQNLRCRAAFAKAKAAVEEHRAAVQDVHAKKQGLQKAVALLQKMAVEAASR